MAATKTHRRRPDLKNLQGLVDELPLRAVRLVTRMCDLEERFAMRLDRWMRRNDAQWEPPQEFVNAFSQLVYTGVKISAEIRALEKVRDAGKLSDFDLQEGLRAVAREELVQMSNEEFLALIDVRDQSGADGEPAKH